MDAAKATAKNKKRIILISKTRAVITGLRRALGDKYKLEVYTGGSKVPVQPHHADLVICNVCIDDPEFLPDYYALSQTIDLRTCPALMMVDAATEEQQRTYLSHGANYVLLAPFNYSIIALTIANLLQVSAPLARIKSHSFDTLTSLPNTEYFFDFCGELLRTHTELSYELLFFDVEKFKTLNDALGFETGNDFLVGVAQVIKDEFAGDIISRMGDDHFAVLTTAKQGNLQHIRNVHMRVYNNTYHFPMEINIGIYPLHPGDSINTAYDRAKLTCDHIKDESGRFYAVYDDKFRENMIFEKAINDRLELAMQSGYMEVYYQPVVRTLSGKVCGFECLSRWNDPLLGFLTPDKFIPTLEKNHNIHLLDLYIAEKACQAINAFREERGMALPLSVNISRMDFEACDIVAELVRLTERYGIPHDLLHVEVTESALNGKDNELGAHIEQVRLAGFEIWIDDFGSGYSSLYTLKDFNPSVIKLDRAFLRNLSANPKAKTIISAVISMAKDIGCRTVAEGVERAEEYEFLKQLGCDIIQGYYFYKPMPRAEAALLTDLEAECDRDYYNKLGKINYQNTHLLSEESDAVFATLNTPLSICEIEEGRERLLYTSAGFVEMLSSIGIPTVQRFEDFLNDTSCDDYETLRQPIYRTLAGGGYERVDFMVDGRPCRLVCKRIAKTNKRGAFFLLLYNKQYVDTLIQENDASTYMNFMCNIYDRIDYIDYENDTIRNIYLNSQYLSNLFEGSTVADGVESFARHNIVEEDYEDFLYFYSKESLQKHLVGSQRHIAGLYRVKTPGGGIRKQVFLIARINRSGGTQYLSCVRNFNTGRNDRIMDYSDKIVTETLDLLKDGVAFFQYEGSTARAVYANLALLSLLEADRNDFLGKTYAALNAQVVMKDRPIVTDMLRELRETGECYAIYRFTAYRSGHIVWLMVRGKLAEGNDGRVAYMTFSDVTEQQNRIDREQRLAQCLQIISSRESFRTNTARIMRIVRGYYDADRVYIFEFDQNTQTMSTTHEYVRRGLPQCKAAMQCLPLSAVSHWRRELDAGTAVFINDLDELAQDEACLPGYQSLRARGVTCLMAAPLRYKRRIYGYIGVDDPRKNTSDHDFLVSLARYLSQGMYDVEVTGNLTQLSYFDTLTGLPNRNAYNRYLKQCENTSVQQLGIAFLDINCLKRVNDSKGHLCGDKLIREVAELLKQHFPAESIYHISGDEFVILHGGAALETFELDMKALREDIHAHGDRVSLGFIWRAEVDNVEALISAAEEHMYKDKADFYRSHPLLERRQTQ